MHHITFYDRAWQTQQVENVSGSIRPCRHDLMPFLSQQHAHARQFAIDKIYRPMLRATTSTYDDSSWLHCIHVMVLVRVSNL